MGKYMRKAKLTGDVVVVMDVSQSSLGVRTRAKTLALQKLQHSNATDEPPPEQNVEWTYLQLRNRRLEKPPLQQSTCYRQQNPNTSRSVIRSGGSVSVGSSPSNGNDSVWDASKNKADEESEANWDFATGETPPGENNTDFDDRERSTRESTPCIQISISRIMPSAQEIEGFFARHVQEQQRQFSERYNFDIVNEKPLQGRFEWVKVQP